MTKTTSSVLGAVFVSVCGLLAAKAAAGDQPQSTPMPAKPAIVDVTLQEGGVLLGTLVDPQHRPIGGAKVTLRRDGAEVGSTETAQNGQFQFAQLTGGLYQVETPHGSGLFRLWAPNTAPPHARPGILMIASPDVVRGQGPVPGYAPPIEHLPPVWVESGPVISKDHIHGAIVGGLITGFTFWALDHNPSGS